MTEIIVGGRMPDPASQPIEYLNLFLTNKFIDNIVRETNAYAKEFIETYGEYLARHPRSRIHTSWIRKGNTTREEFRAFLGILIAMGLVDKPTIESYWDTCHPVIATPFFYEHFNRDRFMLLLKFMHYNDNSRKPPEDSPDYNVYYKIQPVIDHMSDAFKKHFVPSCIVSIDESMIRFRGKLPLHVRVFMPQKRHARFGIKVWCLCDTETGYTYYFELYRGGVDRSLEPEGATYSLVMRMMDKGSLLYKGYHLGLDN